MFRQQCRTLVGAGIVLGAMFLLPLTPLFAQGESASRPLAAGQHVRLTLRATADAPGRELEGDITSLDTAGLTLMLGDSAARVPRAMIESVKRAEVSRLMGVVVGWLAAVPFAYFSCRDEKYECGAGSAIGAAGMLIGGLIGWRQWESVQFP